MTTTTGQRERCEECDLPLATQQDYDACDHDCPTCEKCAAVCWSSFNLTRCSHPIDWRSRALAAEARLAGTEGAVEPAREEVEALVESLWDASEVVFQAGTSQEPVPWSSAGQITKRTWRAMAREAWRLGARPRGDR